MARFTLVPVGPTCSFKKICQGKAWVGRVVKMGDNAGFYAVINSKDGKTEYTGKTEKEAFEEVVARALGFANAGHLHDSNKLIRRKNAQNKARVGHALREALHNRNFDPLGDILEGK